MWGSVQDLNRAAQAGIAEFALLSDLDDFGFNLKSVRWVEGFIDRIRSQPGFPTDQPGGLLEVIGAFLGESLIAATGGTWHFEEQADDWCVLFPNGSKAFPFVKVAKQFREGTEGGESIASFYWVTVTHVATGQLGSAPTVQHLVEQRTLRRLFDRLKRRHRS